MAVSFLVFAYACQGTSESDTLTEAPELIYIHVRSVWSGEVETCWMGYDFSF